MEWNGIGEWLRARERLSGSRLALIEGERQVTYGELNRRVNRLGAVLRDRFGVVRGARVAVLAHNSIPYVELFFAAAKLGAILVPLNVRLTQAEWAYQLADAGAETLFVGPELAREAAPLLAKDHPCWHGTTGSSLRQLAPLEGEAYEEMLGVATEEEPGAPSSLADPHVIMYTSGTTGRPKGAILTQGNHFWNALNIGSSVDLASTDTTLNALPFFHIGGIGLFTVPTLHAGGTAVIMRKFDPGAALQLIAQHRVTVMLGVPAIWLFLLQHTDFATADLSSLRATLSGGAPLPVALIEAYWEQKRLTLRQGMGLTETSPTLFVIDHAHALTKRGSVGKAMLHTEAAIWDEQNQPLPPGQVGELVCRGPNLFQGYWNMAEATREAFRGGWFHTGDLAYTDADGYFYLVDRKKDMIISGGENVYSAEVEDVLYRLEQVAEVAVIGREDGRWGEAPIAIAALKPGQTLTLTELQAFCAAHLARFKIPKDLVLVDALPRNAAGKVQKPVLRERYGRSQEGE